MGEAFVCGASGALGGSARSACRPDGNNLETSSGGRVRRAVLLADVLAVIEGDLPFSNPGC